VSAKGIFAFPFSPPLFSRARSGGGCFSSSPSPASPQACLLVFGAPPGNTPGLRPSEAKRSGAERSGAFRPRLRGVHFTVLLSYSSFFPSGLTGALIPASFVGKEPYVHMYFLGRLFLRVCFVPRAIESKSHTFFFDSSSLFHCFCFCFAKLGEY